MTPEDGWLRSVAGEWDSYQDSGEYYPACRGKKHSTAWARPRWNIRFARSSTYWCDDCLPAKYRAAADSVVPGGRRAARIRKDGTQVPAVIKE